MALIIPRRLGVTWADSFTRANQSGLGNGWTLGNGTTQPAISGNTATCTTTTAGYYPAILQQARTDRYYVQVLLGTVSSVGVAVLIRCNAGFTQQVGAFASTAATTTAILYIQTATASTNTTEASGSGTWSAGQYLTMTAVGNVYSVYRSSTPVWQTTSSVLSWTDSSNVVSLGLGNRYGGIAVQYGGPASTPVSNFVLSDF